MADTNLNNLRFSIGGVPLSDDFHARVSAALKETLQQELEAEGVKGEAGATAIHAAGHSNSTQQLSLRK
jgi:hypothetical protein